MITSIKTKKETSKSIELAEFDFYDQYACKSLPITIAASFFNYSQSISSKDKNTALANFANDLSTTCLHFLALLALCDYAQGKTSKTADMYSAIESMLNKPGPGVWLGFLRTYYHYSIETGFEGRFPELIAFIEKHEIEKTKNPAVEVYRNYKTETSEEMGLLEFLVTFRNNMAHSKGYDEKTANALAEPITMLATHLAAELSFLSSYKLVLVNKDKTKVYIDKEALKIVDTNSNSELFVETKTDYISLHPFLILDKAVVSPVNDIFLLESVKKGKAIYSSHSGNITKSSTEDPCAARLFGLLEKVYVEPWLIAWNKLTWQKLNERSRKLLVSLQSEEPPKKQDLPEENDSSVIKALEITRESFFNSGKRVLFLASGGSQIKSYQENLFEPDSWNFDVDKDILIPIIPDMINKYLTGDEPFSFERAISEEIGVSGELKNVISAVSNKQSEGRLFLMFHGVEQYSLKEKHLAIKYLFDFIYRLKNIESVFFIIHSTSDYYLSSFNKYMQVFRDKIEDITYTNNNRIVVSLYEKNKGKNGLIERMRNKISSFLK